MAHVASVEFEFVGDLKPEKVWGKWVNNIDPQQNGGYQLQGEFAHMVAKDPKDLSQGCRLTFPDILLEKGAMYWSISYTTGSVNKATGGNSGIYNIGGVSKYVPGHQQPAGLDLPPSVVTGVKNELRWTNLACETVGVYPSESGRHLRKCVDLMQVMESKGEAKFNNSYYTSLNNQPVKQQKWEKLTGQSPIEAAYRNATPSERERMLRGDWGEDTNARVDMRSAAPNLQLFEVCKLPNNCILRRDSYGHHFVEFTGMTGGLRQTQILLPLAEYLTSLSRADEQRIMANYNMRTCIQKALFEENALAAQTARQTRLLFPLYLTEKPNDDEEDPF